MRILPIPRLVFPTYVYPVSQYWCHYQIDGKKVPLGVPGAQRPVTSTQTREDYPFVPLRRGGIPKDAAGSVLLYVSFSPIICS